MTTEGADHKHQSTYRNEKEEKQLNCNRIRSVLFCITGPPEDQPTINIQQGESQAEFSPGGCDVNKVSYTSNDKVNVMVKSSVKSTPAASFMVAGQEVSPDCTKTGECPGEVICELSSPYEFSFQDEGTQQLDVIFAFDEAHIWEFCIEAGTGCSYVLGYFFN